MALYRQGKAAMDSSGIVTGTGTNWQSALTLIRPGATILFLSSPIQMAVVNKVVSDTQINAITTNGAVVPFSDYAILLSDSLSVDGLAQDVAETLRYYQSQETVIAEAVDFFKDFDLATLQALVEQVKEDAAASEQAAAESQQAAAESQQAAAESQQAAAESQQAATDAEATRDGIQQIIDDAGEQSTLVALAQPDGLKNIGRVPNAAALRSVSPTINGQKIDLAAYNAQWSNTASGSLGGGLFYYDATDSTSPDNGGTCFVTASGKRIKRIFTGPICVEWFGSDGAGSAKKISDVIASGAYANLAAVQAVYPGVNSVDDYFDLAAIKNAMAACADGQQIVLKQGGTYHLNRTASGGRCSGVIGNGSKIVVSDTTDAMTAISIGNQKGAITPTSISVTARTRAATIPGISAIAAVGDLVSFASTDVRVPTNEAAGVRAYNHGMRAVITAIVGDTLTLDRDFYATFAVSAVTVHRGYSKMRVSDLTIDATGIPSVAYLVSALSIIGTNIEVSGCNIRGSKYCATGVSLLGSVSTLSNSRIGGFCNVNGVESGGRVGYGVYADCHDTLIENCHFFDNKHHATCASRDYVMEGFTVRGGSSYSEKSSNFNVMAAFDLHANVTGVPVFEGIHIHAAGAAFGIRNGAAKISNNYIYIHRETDPTPAAIGVDEWRTVYGIYVENNTFDGSSNLNMFNFGNHDSVSNIHILNNRGSIGALMRQQANIGIISGFYVSGNKLKGMTGIIEISKRGPASPLTLLTLIDSLSFKNNDFQVNNTLGIPPIYIWCSSETAAADKLELKNFSLVGSNINASDTPIKLAYLKATGRFVIKDVNLSHAVSSSVSTAPTQYSAVFENCSFSDSSISVSAPGAILYSGIQTYPDEVLSYKLEFVGCRVSAVLFSDSRNSESSYMQFLTGTNLSDCTLTSTYGSKVAFVVTRTNTGWASSGIVDINNCRMIGGSGNAVFISAGYTGNKISVRNNIWNVGINDLSGTNFLSSGNNLIS